MKTIIIIAKVPDDARVIGFDYELGSDLTDPNQFERLKKHYQPDFKEFIPPTDDTIIAGSKTVCKGFLMQQGFIRCATWFKSLLQ